MIPKTIKNEPDKLVEIITKTDKGEIPEVLEFFSGGKNKSFDQKVKMLGYLQTPWIF